MMANVRPRCLSLSAARTPSSNFLILTLKRWENMQCRGVYIDSNLVTVLKTLSSAVHRDVVRDQCHPEQLHKQVPHVTWQLVESA
jgi:hypothetical protein